MSMSALAARYGEEVEAQPGEIELIETEPFLVGRPVLEIEGGLSERPAIWTRASQRDDVRLLDGLFVSLLTKRESRFLTHSFYPDELIAVRQAITEVAGDFFNTARGFLGRATVYGPLSPYRKAPRFVGFELVGGIAVRVMKERSSILRIIDQDLELRPFTPHVTILRTNDLQLAEAVRDDLNLSLGEAELIPVKLGQAEVA